MPSEMLRLGKLKDLPDSVKTHLEQSPSKAG